MMTIIDRWIGHYATVTNGESVLFRENLLQACEIHGVSEYNLCHAFAKAVAESFASGKLDTDGAAFAISDLFWASECSLGGFALKVFDALEDGESTVSDVKELLSAEVAPDAA